ncbi:MAG: chromosome segregation protein SMC, partial [Bauldia sp.]|nr:chromosome segregation protein SMC [Bauldia sp.]
GLKRQARQATRYRGLSGEIRKAEAAAFYLRWLAAGTAVKEAEAVLAAAATLLEEQATNQARSARDHAVAAAALPALRDRAAAAGATVQRLAIEGQQLEGEERRARERIADLRGRIAQSEADIARERQIAAEHRQMMERLAEEEGSLRAADEGTEAREAEALGAVRAAEAALGEAERKVGEATTETAALRARRDTLAAAARNAATRAELSRNELAGVERELGASGARASEDAARLTTAREGVAEAETSLAAIEETAHSAEAYTLKTAEAEKVAREARLLAERKLGDVDAERRAVARLLQRDTTGAAPIIDKVTVDPAYERAFAAALGEDLDAPLETNSPVHWREIAALPDDAALPAGVEALANHVRAPRELARLLVQVGVVSAEDGGRLQGALRPGQMLVTRSGDLWRWDGFVASGDAPTAAAERLANRNRLAALDADAETLRAKAAEAKAAFETEASRAASARLAEQESRRFARDARAKLDIARSALAELERNLSRVSTRAAALAEAKARLEKAVAESEAAANEAREELTALPDLQAGETALATLRADVAEIRARVMEARMAHDGIRRETAARRARLGAIAEERGNWLARADKAEAQVVALGERRGEAETELAALAERPAAIALERQKLLSAISAAEAARSEAQEALLAGEAAEAEAGKAARAGLEQLSSAREERVRAEERRLAAEERRNEIVARIGEAMDREPHTLAEIAELKPGAPLPDLGAVEGKLERLRDERERLGGVNLQADTEAQEVTQRRDTLVAERDDLIAAIQRLRQAILSLNQEGRERLLAAFSVVDGHFRRLFTHLFGGGSAELQLTESDDPLQAGLEIVAKPPGKKPQTMTLLSGGEQALTAMSLIFAVFLTNPAPICVLDEVDAPLDDANVERFCNLLDEMARSTDTRFVVITHHPVTMSRMTRLFGVTMVERGVSQLVSVDLATAERFRETA